MQFESGLSSSASSITLRAQNREKIHSSLIATIAVPKSGERPNSPPLFATGRTRLKCCLVEHFHKWQTQIAFSDCSKRQGQQTSGTQTSGTQIVVEERHGYSYFPLETRALICVPAVSRPQSVSPQSALICVPAVAVPQSALICVPAVLGPAVGVDLCPRSPCPRSPPAVHLPSPRYQALPGLCDK